MAYLKLPFGVTDYSAGIQSVNQLRDNLQTTYDGFSPEHGTKEVSVGNGGRIIYPGTFEQLGHHNTPKIPRAVVRTAQVAQSFGVISLGAIVARPVVTGVVRFATGLFFIGIAELSDFYAEVEAEQASAASNRFVIPRSGFGGAGGAVGIALECYEKSGTDFVLADFDWAAHIYGTT